MKTYRIEAEALLENSVFSTRLTEKNVRGKQEKTNNITRNGKCYEKKNKFFMWENSISFQSIACHYHECPQLKFFLPLLLLLLQPSGMKIFIDFNLMERKIKRKMARVSLRI